jgi:arginyl-tRNA synthetase
VLGTDGKILRTRAGDTVKLSELLQEAVDRAEQVLDEMDTAAGRDTPERQAIAEAVGIGAVKYADLSTSRESEYVFDLDRMVSFKGNTGPYLQYAAARIRSLFHKAGQQPESAAGPVRLTEAAERALALRLLGFGAAVSAAGRTAEPHKLAAYLFDIAAAFTSFYEQCPVLQAEPAARVSRLALAGLTLRVLLTGLDLLGIPVPDRM